LANRLRRTLMTDSPELFFDFDPHRPGPSYVRVRHLRPNLVCALREYARSSSVLQSVLRVMVAGTETSADEELPDVGGHRQILESGLQFMPYFPFEPGVRYRATFDPHALADIGPSNRLVLEFLPAKEQMVSPAEVTNIFPSSELLPENLLRFYLCFSNPMQRGRAAAEISLLGPDGEPVPDALYRAPVELWDRSMRCLTVLLDPGRLKRGVGPNRELGPPLKCGQTYALAVGAGMTDITGSPLHKVVHKCFCVTDAVREPIAIEQWKIIPPDTNSRQPLTLISPAPLDWALLSNSIGVAAPNGQPIQGQITIDRCETAMEVYAVLALDHGLLRDPRWIGPRRCLRQYRDSAVRPGAAIWHRSGLRGRESVNFILPNARSKWFTNRPTPSGLRAASARVRNRNDRVRRQGAPASSCGATMTRRSKMATSERSVTTSAELLTAAEDINIKTIVIAADLSNLPSFRLLQGQSLTGAGPHATLRFAEGQDGLQLSADNRVEGVELMTDPARRAIFNDTTVAEFGRLVLKDLRVTGVIQLLARDLVRGGHVEADDIDIVAADARHYDERPKGYGVEVIPGACTLWNQQADSAVIITANLLGLSAGRAGAPVRGSGIFVGGAGDTGGRLIVRSLETGAVHSDGGIVAGTPDRITGGVFVVSGAYADSVRNRGPVTT